MFQRILSLLLLAVFVTTIGPACFADSKDADSKATENKNPHAWRPLFDGKSLEGWEIPNFGGQGEVSVKDGAIVMEMGNDMTGIRLAADEEGAGVELPKINYELQFDGIRTQGVDFFCTATVPYNDSYFSLVVGGWGGTVVGISSIDGYDAAENETAQYYGFKDERWYRVRLRVSEHKIEAWVNEIGKDGKLIDDDKFIERNGGEKRMVDIETEGRRISTRFEVDLCKPLGLSTWCTEGRVKNIRIRSLKPEELKAIKKEVDEDNNWF